MNPELLLGRLGLSEHESCLYMALLRLRDASISDLHSETRLYRPVIYRTLPLLIERGLVTRSIKGKRKRYTANSPQHLRDVAERIATDVEETLPALQELFDAKTARPSVKYFEGKSGLSQVYTDVVASLKKDEVFYRYSSAAELGKVEKYIPAIYKKIRDEKSLQRFVISSAVIAARTPKDMNRATKVVPSGAGLFETNVTQLIYGDKVALIDYNSETAVVIENAQVAAFQKEIFKLCYKYLPDVPSRRTPTA